MTDARRISDLVFKRYPHGKNIRAAGEDVRAGEVVLARGTVLQPAAIGMLAALGRTHVTVHRRPRVAILSTGDEVIDAASGHQGVGRRTGMSDASGSTGWVYDARGRVTEETQVISGTGGGTFKTQWTYYADDQVKSMTYPGGSGGQTGESVTTTYNLMGRVNTVSGSQYLRGGHHLQRRRAGQGAHVGDRPGADHLVGLLRLLGER